MQIAKNLVVGSERDGIYGIWRKVREAFVARSLGNIFSKEELLAIYLNTMEFGRHRGVTAHGIEQAARLHFGKHAHDLNLYESAMLVGTLQATTAYNPSRNPRAADGRARAVLARMIKHGFITKAQARDAIAGGRRPGQVKPVNANPHFYLDAAYDEFRTIAAKRDEEQIRFVVSLDMKLQLKGEEQIRSAVRDARHLGADSGALLSLNLDGGIVALVGGPDFADSQYNHATAGRRQPGSTFKLFTVLAALEQGYQPSDLIDDAPVKDDWPRNNNSEYRGQVSLERILVDSINAAAVQLGLRLTTKEVAAMARRLGVQSKLSGSPAMLLGVDEVTLLEMTAAYGAIANDGYAVKPHATSLAMGSWGEVFYRWRPPLLAIRAVDRNATGAVRGMLRKVVTEGTGHRAFMKSQWSAGKTGTSQHNRDAWFVGFTDHSVTGVWLGNDSGGVMQNITGGGLPARVWHAFSAA